MPIPSVTEVTQSNFGDLPVKHGPEVLTEAPQESSPKKKHKKRGGEYGWGT